MDRPRRAAVGRAGDVAYLVAVDEDELPFDRGCVRNVLEYVKQGARGTYAFHYGPDGRLRKHPCRCCFR